MKTVQNRHRWQYIALGTIAALSVLFYYRLRPTVLAEAYSPHRAGGYIRIVEVPTHWLDALTFRYNPYYRFEFYLPGDYLWSAASFSGESYNAQTASITWNSDSTAIVF